MAEQKSWLKVQLSGMVEGKGTADYTKAGSGAIVLVDSGKGIEGICAGEWSIMTLAVALNVFKTSVGWKMFARALRMMIWRNVKEALAGKATAAEMEAHDGEEA